MCWTWQTRRTQNPLVVTPCGFDPHHRHKKAPLAVSRPRALFYFRCWGVEQDGAPQRAKNSPVDCFLVRGRPPPPAFLIPKPFIGLGIFFVADRISACLPFCLPLLPQMADKIDLKTRRGAGRKRRSSAAKTKKKQKTTPDGYKNHPA